MFKGWTLPKEVVLFIDNQKYAYVAYSDNKSSLDAGKRWVGKEGKSVKTANKDFKLTILKKNSCYGWECLIEKEADNISAIVVLNEDLLNNLIIQSDFKHGVCKQKVSWANKKRRCKKKRNKARGFPRYGSPRVLIYHTAKKNYLILKKGYSKHTGRNTALFADY